MYISLTIPGHNEGSFKATAPRILRPLRSLRDGERRHTRLWTDRKRLVVWEPRSLATPPTGNVPGVSAMNDPWEFRSTRTGLLRSSVIAAWQARKDRWPRCIPSLDKLTCMKTTACFCFSQPDSFWHVAAATMPFWKDRLWALWKLGRWPLIARTC